MARATNQTAEESETIKATIDVRPVRTTDDDDEVIVETIEGDEMLVYQDELDVRVIDSEKSIREAMKMGAEYGLGLDMMEIQAEDADRAREEIGMGIDEGLHQSATWANSYLPHFRYLSGNTDEGHGTYRTSETVYDVATSETTEPRYVLDEIHDAFSEGLWDVVNHKIEGSFEE